MLKTIGQVIDEWIDTDDFVSLITDGLMAIGTDKELELIKYGVESLSFLLNLTCQCKDNKMYKTDSHQELAIKNL